MLVHVIAERLPHGMAADVPELKLPGRFVQHFVSSASVKRLLPKSGFNLAAPCRE